MERLCVLIPDHWQTKSSKSNTPQLVDLDAESGEYKHAEEVFAIKYPSRKICKIERIENRHAYLSAMIEKERMLFVDKVLVKESQQLHEICDFCKDYYIKHPNEIKTSRKKCSNATSHENYIFFNSIETSVSAKYFYPLYYIVSEAKDAQPETVLPIESTKSDE